ncbi:hypothetical protein U6W31_03175 [Brucella melitensis]|uniref:hypothetical protein n=1 Tax=Brucella melitensis TaxID=29459 RepID=UPI00398B563D
MRPVRVQLRASVLASAQMARGRRMSVKGSEPGIRTATHIPVRMKQAAVPRPRGPCHPAGRSGFPCLLAGFSKNPPA